MERSQPQPGQMRGPPQQQQQQQRSPQTDPWSHPGLEGF
jgi:hypothetical protein